MNGSGCRHPLPDSRKTITAVTVADTLTAFKSNTMADDYEIDSEMICPKCGHSPLHYRDCTNFSCEDGYEDESEDDPINFMPGELLTECPECRGTGVEWWCPSCGENLSGILVTKQIDTSKFSHTDEPGMHYTACYMPLILDPCCGGRQFWFDKSNPDVLFCDVRVMEPKVVGSGKDARVRKCLPDRVMDFRNMDLPDETFRLVVFDPPHLFLGENSYMAQSYGRLDKQTWKEDMSKGFSECFRVLKDEGILIFKWNECDVPLKDVLALTEHKPLFGHPSGKAQKTHWVTFMKRSANGI